MTSGSTVVSAGTALTITHNFGAIDYLAVGYLKNGPVYVPVSDSGTTLAIASLFNDLFNRPDNNLVGNGWIETVNAGSMFGSDGSGTAVRLAGNTMITGGGFAGTPETAATQVLTGHANQDLRITWRFRQTGGNGDSFNLAIRRPTTGTYIVSGQGYGLQLTVNSPNGTICIVDNGSCVVSNDSIPGMSTNIDFYAELIAQRNGAVEGRLACERKPAIAAADLVDPAAVSPATRHQPIG